MKVDVGNNKLAKWAFFLERAKAGRAFTSIFVLCFTESTQTFHYLWFRCLRYMLQVLLYQATTSRILRLKLPQEEKTFKGTSLYVIDPFVHPLVYLFYVNFSDNYSFECLNKINCNQKFSNQSWFGNLCIRNPELPTFSKGKSVLLGRFQVFWIKVDEAL